MDNSIAEEMADHTIAEEGTVTDIVKEENGNIRGGDLGANIIADLILAYRITALANSETDVLDKKNIEALNFCLAAI